jgi:hypothetical protein
MNFETISISKLPEAPKIEITDGCEFVFNTDDIKTKRKSWGFLKRALSSMWEVINEAGTVTSEDRQVIVCDATAAAFDVNLPIAANAASFCVRVIKKDASVNAVTILPDGAETINGAASYILAAQWDGVEVWCDGTEWYILATI